mmetsp:Transcript_53660/g.81436  ORF Transcript_53660/g.81436 Transcript_53660/m.81436 type:complete len:758 (+) Transcript_53660:126-2399(+)
MDRSLLARATDNSDAPTPGYMYNDIAKNAASSPATCVDVAKYLAGRLGSKNNHNIKYKCLKVISKTATSPYLRGQFKRCLAQDPQSMASIKDALQFRGPPDPVRGDQPYERVRTAAKEALDAIYSDTQETNGAPFSTATTSSYGPSPHQQGAGYGGGGGGGGARRMEGIGNPMFKDPRLEPDQASIANMTINDVVSEAKSTVIGIIKDPLARNVDVQIQNQQGTVPRPGGGYQGASYNYPPGRSELMNQTNGEWTMKSNRGPDAMKPPPNYANDAAYYKSRDTGNAYAWAQKGSAVGGGVGGSWASTAPAPHQAAPSISVNSHHNPSVVPQTTGGGGTAVSDGSYEKQLIMELCPPGGMKPEPPSDKLANFARSVSSLNSDVVCPILLDCLEEGQPWIIRAKALWVMLSCIQHGQKPGAPSNPYADFFLACQGEIAPLANHSRAAIRDPAKRIMNSLGVATPVHGAAPLTARPGAAPAAPAPVPAPAAPVPNLLDFDEPAAAPAPVQAPPAAVGGGDSLFGGLNLSGASPSAPPPAPPAAAPPAPASNLLEQMSSAPTPPPAAAQSLFGDMNVKSAAAPAPAPQPAAAPVSQSASMFDNMSLKAEPKTDESASAMPAPSGSAFGFINASASSDATEKKENAPSANARDTFDPLMNMTPNTAKQMMQISPQQMQAMAYQQMMMQQQMQMAQMMAMQQQQKRGSGNMFMPMPGNVPMNVNVMQNPAAAKTSFAFMDQPQRKEDHSFDFIKDTMTKEKKK